MSKKLICFDLDGVLINSKELHFNALNMALSKVDEKYIISWNEHIKYLDGLKTKDKLQYLTKYKNLPEELHDFVWNLKQDLTFEVLENVNENEYLINIFKHLSKFYYLACCSNSIKKTVEIILKKLGIIEFFDLIISNDDVKNSKPHPEIYWKAMCNFNLFPNDCLIIEDSPTGLISAHYSGAKILRVKDFTDISIDKIEKIISDKTKNIPIWKDKTMNVVIPMAGLGSRFTQAGYTFPKPLIEIKGKPMIQIVSENLNVEANFIYIVQKEHRQKFNLDSFLNLISKNCSIIEVDGLTEGAACTTLLAKDLIDNDSPLLLANSDQFIEWNSLDFFYKMNEENNDAGILTFDSIHPKWSYVKLNKDNCVCEVAEKKPISNLATVGIYYWKKGSDYVKYAEQMIEKNIRVNNEFYVCPVFNEAIADGLKIKTYNIKSMWGLGTPEDLEYFVENYDFNSA